MEQPDKDTKPKLSNRERAERKHELINELLAGCATEGDLFGPEGVFTKLKAELMGRLLDAEMTEHLGYEPQGKRRSANSRNGYSTKTVTTESGPVQLQVPRDRDGTFEPQLVKKGQRRLEGFDEKVLALYARGMSTRDIQGHLRELYGTEVSHELISRATESVMQDFRDWQSRPLDAVYPIIYLDALFVSTKHDGQVTKRAYYVALGVTMEGRRDVLGLWVAATEGAKFWLTILSELKNRGVQDVLFICADGLSGLDKAVEATFPETVFQTCIVHLIRSALRFVSWADRKKVAAMLKPLYNAESEETAQAELHRLEESFGQRYPSLVRAFKNRWEHFVPFLAYPPEIRRMLYTTNAIESLNSQLRKVLRNRGVFPNEDSVLKVLFLAIGNAKTKWRASRDWGQVLSQLDILFEGRLPA
jgi:transposase-like protein